MKDGSLTGDDIPDCSTANDDLEYGAIESDYNYPTSNRSWKVGVVSKDSAYLIVTRGYIMCIAVR